MSLLPGDVDMARRIERETPHVVQATPVRYKQNR